MYIIVIMTLVGTCYICSKPAMYSCSVCGRIVCSDCYIKPRRICTGCLGTMGESFNEKEENDSQEILF